jgi:hypothetical protein
MSIFRSTLPQFVQDQLNTRTSVISSPNARGPNFLLYTTGKNGWVRMSSFVDYFSKDKYSGSDLAQKYILEGGTINRTGNTEKLRFGINTPGGAYLSNLDGFNSKGQAPKKGTTLYNDFRQLGARPMPGITSVDINNKSAYGSLKEANIRYYCWDKHQLEELELLYMRTGYTVLLEWGWSQYLDSPTASPKSIGSGIDIFNNSLTDDKVYSQIEKLKKDYHGNYDALLGHVKNFSWQLLPNGGYECSTVLISRGEIISTLRLTHNSLAGDPQVGEDDKPLSTFERIFLNYKAWINNIEVNKDYQEARSSKKDDEKANKFDKVNSEFKPIIKEGVETQNQINETSVANFVTELETKLKKIPQFEIYGYNKSGEWLENKFRTGEQYWDDIKNSKGFCLPVDSSANDGSAIEYIRLDFFLVILNAYFNLKNEEGNLISKIVIPRNLPILASEDSVSVDPKTCLIKNPNATFITDTDISLNANPDDQGFQPYALESFIYEGNRRVATTNKNQILEFHLSKYINISESKKFSFGILDNIYISINKIIEVYRSKGGNSPDGVLIIDYLKDLMSSISSALGGINDLQIHSDKSSIRIIDVKYLEIKTGNKTNNFDKYNFDLVGLKSICRDVKISSRIFDSQATMIAIAAQNRNNIGDIYSSTQTYFNQGLTDRLLSTKVVDDNTPKIDLINNDAELTYYVNLWKSISNIAYYLKEKCIGIPDVNNGNVASIKAPTDADVNNAKSILKTIHYQINGGDVDYKALIPFELEIILDGISGLVVGQIFTIDKSILPKDYTLKNLGFIITGINHSLQNNDWTTTIKTQVCLLDQDELSNLSLSKSQKSKIKNTLNNFKVANTQTQFLAYAITDFLYTNVIYSFSFTVGNPNKNTWSLGSYIKHSTTFEQYLKTWIEEVKKKYPDVYEKELNGVKIFPKTPSDISTISLDGTNSVKFNLNLVDNALSSYTSKTPNEINSTLFDQTSKNTITLKEYFAKSDIGSSESSNYQNKAISARNSSIFNRLFRFQGNYPNEFLGNITYANSIFGRGLIGKIKDFNLEDQGNRDGLTVEINVLSVNIEAYNAKDEDKILIRSITSPYAGKNSGIEKYLTELYLFQPTIEGKEVWNKLFDYVTKDFLNINGALSVGNTNNQNQLFVADRSTLAEIDSTNLKSIYDIEKFKINTKPVKLPNK